MFKENEKRTYYKMTSLTLDEKLTLTAKSDELKLYNKAVPHIKYYNTKDKAVFWDAANYLLEQQKNEPYALITTLDLTLELPKWKAMKETKEEAKNKPKAKDELCEFVRSQWLLDVKKEEVIVKIMKNPVFAGIYIKTTAIQNFIDKQFRMIKIEKPPFRWQPYWVPVEIADFLQYMSDWAMAFHYEVELPCKDGIYESYEEAMQVFQQHHDRGKCLIISAKGGLGKTLLFGCMGPCSYWKDRFNYDQWNSWGYFNWFDDVDVYNEQTTQQDIKIGPKDFKYLKTWLGGQFNSGFTGKYRAVKNVCNFKPCVFITNNEFEERFNENALNYLRDINATFVRVTEPLFEPKNTRTIGGFAKWRKIDPRDYFYFQEIYGPKHPEELEAYNKAKEENASEPEPEPELDPIEDGRCEHQAKKRRWVPTEVEGVFALDP